MTEQQLYIQKDSDIIRYIRFPLIAWVVFLHSVLCFSQNLMNLGYPVCAYLIGFLTIGIRTPIFFFISGYCFFLNVQNFDLSIYINKLNRRSHTLLIPYLFWNLIVIGYFVLAHYFFPNIIDENVATYSISDFIRAFWDKSGGDPVAYQLWFLRDLMVVCVFTPLVWFLVKRMKFYGLAFLLVFYFTDILIPCKSALVFFSLGAFFSTNRISFSMALKEKFIRFKGLYIWVIAVALTLIFPQEQLLRKICVILYSAAFVSLISYIVGKEHRMPGVLNDSNYFVYLWHGFPIMVVKFLYIKLLNPSTGFEYVIGSFIVWAVTLTIAVALYYVINRFLPRTTALLLGRKR